MTTMKEKIDETTYIIIAIDNNRSGMQQLLGVIQKSLEWKDGIKIEPSVLLYEGAVDELMGRHTDVVLINITPDGRGVNRGLVILRDFRKENKRTPVILYSDIVREGDPYLYQLTAGNYIEMINDLNVFAFSLKDPDHLAGHIKRAAVAIDAVLSGMEDLVLNFGESGYYTIGDTPYSAKELLHELRIGSPAGEEFRAHVTKMILTYFRKFGC